MSAGLSWAFVALGALVVLYWAATMLHIFNLRRRVAFWKDATVRYMGEFDDVLGLQEMLYFEIAQELRRALDAQPAELREAQLRSLVESIESAADEMRHSYHASHTVMNGFRQATGMESLPLRPTRRTP